MRSLAYLYVCMYVCMYGGMSWGRTAYDFFFREGGRDGVVTGICFFVVVNVVVVAVEARGESESSVLYA